MYKLIAVSLAASLLLATGCAVESSAGAGDRVTSGATTASADVSLAPAVAQSAEPTQDDLVSSVTLRSCDIDKDWGVQFTGDIVNGSDEISDFAVGVEILNAAGDRVDEGYALANAVKPGQKVKIDGGGMANAEDLPAEVTCQVMTVDRVTSNP